MGPQQVSSGAGAGINNYCSLPATSLRRDTEAGCSERWGRLARSHTEAGVGPEISLEGQRGTVPDPHHQA